MGSLVRAAKENDRRGILEATRDILAYAIEDCDSKRDLAALTKRLIETCDLIDALPNPEDVDPIDDLASFIEEFDQYDDPRADDGAD